MRMRRSTPLSKRSAEQPRRASRRNSPRRSATSADGTWRGELEQARLRLVALNLARAADEALAWAER
jgi:hypothetical protein